MCCNSCGGMKRKRRSISKSSSRGWECSRMRGRSCRACRVSGGRWSFISTGTRRWGWNSPSFWSRCSLTCNRLGRMKKCMWGFSRRKSGRYWRRVACRPKEPGSLQEPGGAGCRRPWIAIWKGSRWGPFGRNSGS